MPRPRMVIAAVVALGAVATAGAGAVGVAQAHGPAPTTPSRHAEPTPVPARPAPARADRAARSTEVAPLARLSPPDVVVGLPRQIAADRLQRLRRQPGVSAVAVLDPGQLHIRGRTLHAIGVDAGEVRGFTPSLTARSDVLWQSVARGELTVTYAKSRPLRHRLGRTVTVRGSHHHLVQVRMGAFASVGLGNAQAVVDHADARLLGLHVGRRIVISAPQLSIGAVEAMVHRILGRRAQIHGARPETVDQSVMSDYARATIPSSYLALYRAAATTCAGLPWTVLAAIGAVETGHGVDTRTSSKGAVGPMQFLPSTFAAYGIDGGGDGFVDIRDPADAVYSAARYLCLSGGGRGGQALYDAIWAYNHADWYVREVLAYAVAYS
ncbi:MAG: hypothetical protein QOJ03_3321 [Frankiaceae bacterium]|nr:hypothetical protein [Frankiaceae bacterium]